MEGALATASDLVATRSCSSSRACRCRGCSNGSIVKAKRSNSIKT